MPMCGCQFTPKSSGPPEKPDDFLGPISSHIRKGSDSSGGIAEGNGCSTAKEGS